MRLIRIGREAGSEYRADHPTVSRRHAELVVTDQGRLYLTDCRSSGGTFCETAGQWVPVRQSFVEPGQRLRFGEFEVQAQSLTARAGGSDTRRV